LDTLNNQSITMFLRMMGFGELYSAVSCQSWLHFLTILIHFGF